MAPKPRTKTRTRTEAIPTHHLKIGQVAKQSGVSVSTVKYYLREGLIPPPVKGDGAMSFYSREHVDRIVMIKKMQKEQYYPLNVIKTMLSTAAVADTPSTNEPMEVSSWEINAYAELISQGELVSRTGCSVERIRLLEEKGYIDPVQTLQGTCYELVDCEIAALFKQREDLGLPFEHTFDVFGIYRKHLRRAINEDVALCVKKVLSEQKGADYIVYITEADKTAAAFVNLFKHKYTRIRIGSIIRKHETIPMHIAEALHFRCLETITWVDRAAAGIDMPPVTLEQVLDLGTPAAGGQTAGSAVCSPAKRPDVLSVVNGIFAMIEGRIETALADFRQVDAEGPFFAAAEALSALAHIVGVSKFTGMQPFLNEMRTVLGCLQRSRQTTNQGTAGLLAAYGRLVAIAVRSNFFDSENESQREFERMTADSEQLLADPRTPPVIQPFVRELIQKSLYFMSLMCLGSELTEQAGRWLDRMLENESEGFYAAWASRKRIDIQNNS